MVKLKLPKVTRDFVLKLFSSRPKQNKTETSLTKRQLMWLGNYPLHLFEEHAAAVYKAIIEAGFPAMIPIDNRTEVLGGV